MAMAGGVTAFLLCLSMLVLCAAAEKSCDSTDGDCPMRQSMSLLQVNFEMEKVSTKHSAHGQKWFVCRLKIPEQRSDEEKAEGVDNVDEMQCTKHMDFKEICCARYEDEDFSETGLVDLPEAADDDMQDDDTQNDTSALLQRSHEIVYRVCVTNADGPALGHGHTVSEHIECYPDLTPSELMGVANDKNALLQGDAKEHIGPKKGEIVLRLRLLRFLAQDQPLDQVSRCDEVTSCPDGEPAITVKDAWIKKQEQESEMKYSAFLEVELSDSQRAGGWMSSKFNTRLVSSLSTQGLFRVTHGMDLTVPFDEHVAAFR